MKYVHVILLLLEYLVKLLNYQDTKLEDTTSYVIYKIFWGLIFLLKCHHETLKLPFLLQSSLSVNIKHTSPAQTSTMQTAMLIPGEIKYFMNAWLPHMEQDHRTSVYCWEVWLSLFPEPVEWNKWTHSSTTNQEQTSPKPFNSSRRLFALLL